MRTPRRPGRPRSTDLVRRHADLLDTAFALFDAHGYHAVSLANIVEAAQVAGRTIYSAFGGKAGLLAALVAREHARHAAALAALPAGRDWPERLAVLGCHLRARAAEPAVLALQRSVIACGDAALGQACHAAGPGQFVALLERDLAAARAAGVLDWHGATAELAELFLAIVGGSQLARHLTGPEPLAQDDCARRLALFWHSAGSGRTPAMGRLC